MAGPRVSRGDNKNTGRASISQRETKKRIAEIQKKKAMQKLAKLRAKKGSAKEARITKDLARFAKDAGHRSSVMQRIANRRAQSAGRKR